MARNTVIPTGIANEFGASEIIVTKTDLQGKITYANDVFCRLSELSTQDVLGQPHNLIRHPDMPRSIFKLLWERIQAGKEIFAFVLNMAMSGNHYWVLAHVTPTIVDGQIVGYHSNRRRPTEGEISAIQNVYTQLLAEEKRHSSPRDGMDAATKLLEEMLADAGQSYDEFFWAIRNSSRV
ncbi:transcriptional regulator [Kordiimonas sediminis]|uniref:Transcriptional regulator n=1 Tax=Kordiimonas sediminis TaxID=1735581 RepID=A0A919EAS9_9PROT|nr:PAS domain-containing protein [Kordiimonas sediminis]GHF31129.1 transcriptional regulator [Kordiimonas sediminis]